MVVTIEPGLYFIDMLLNEVKDAGHGDAINWDRVDFFRPYGGIRIEDEVLCTDGEADNLTHGVCGGERLSPSWCDAQSKSCAWRGG